MNQSKACLNINMVNAYNIHKPTTKQLFFFTLWNKQIIILLH